MRCLNQHSNDGGLRCGEWASSPSLLRPDESFSGAYCGMPSRLPWQKRLARRAGGQGLGHGIASGVTVSFVHLLVPLAVVTGHGSYAEARGHSHVVERRPLVSQPIRPEPHQGTSRDETSQFSGGQRNKTAAGLWRFPFLATPSSGRAVESDISSGSRRTHPHQIVAEASK